VEDPTSEEAYCLAVLGATDESVDILIKLLKRYAAEGDSWLLKHIAATLDSLGQEAVPSLISAMAQDPGIASSALKRITGHDFGQDSLAWERWHDQQQ